MSGVLETMWYTVCSRPALLQGAAGREERVQTPWASQWGEFARLQALTESVLCSLSCSLLSKESPHGAAICPFSGTPIALGIIFSAIGLE